MKRAAGDVTSSQEPATESDARACRAVAYLRCSTLTNSAGDTFERQAAAVRDYARRHRLSLVETFRDTVSGTAELEHREGLSAAVERLRSGDVGVLVVERGDRLARDALVHALLVRRLVELDVAVVTSEGVDLAATDSPTARFVSQVLAALAELDRALVVSRLRSARDRKRAAGGRAEGPEPFGRDEREKAVIERARELKRRRPRGRGASLRWIAAQLDAEGLHPRGGGCWHPESLRRVLGRRP